jgi:hypothetical protein
LALSGFIGVSPPRIWTWPAWPSLLELSIRSDVVGTLPSGILGFGVSPQRIAPIAAALPSR